MHSVVETPDFLSDAKAAGVEPAEREAIITFIASNPQAGDMMVGTGGARKVRFRRPGTGKSGGYRVVFYYGGDDVPLFLLSVFAKNQRTDLSKADRNEIRYVLAELADSYRGGSKR